MTLAAFRSGLRQALRESNGIARRLIFATVLFSSAITAVITAIQLHSEYRSDLSRIDNSFEFIQASAVPALIDSVWVADDKQINTQLAGLLRLRDIEFIGIYAGGRLRWSAGKQLAARTRSQRIALMRPYRGAQVGIGELHAVASIDKVWSRLLDRLIVVLMENAIKTFLVAGFMLLVFQYLVARHLEQLSAYARSLDTLEVEAEAEDLKLDRPGSGRWRPDALDHLVQAVNQMRANLGAAYREMNEANEALRKLNEELEARVSARTSELESFTYSVAHDLKAPLRGIDGYSRLVLEGHAHGLDEEGRRYLNKVRRAAQQMDRLINDLLAYSHQERREIQSEKVDLHALVDAMLAERADEVDSMGADITVAVDCPPVTADREGLALSLRNLLDNALKFSRHASHPAVAISGRDAGAACILAVRDNGVGFDMQYHERIFAIFQRLNRSEDYPGTGIGLAIVQKAMQRMGGRVWAESEPGKGATFYLEIPK